MQWNKKEESVKNSFNDEIADFVFLRTAVLRRICRYKKTKKTIYYDGHALFRWGLQQVKVVTSCGIPIFSVQC